MAVVTLEEAKAHLRVDTADDDALIAGQIGAAINYVENALSRPLMDGEPDAIKAAINLFVAHLYFNTEAVTAGTMAQLPLGIDALLAPYRVVMV